MLIEQTIDKMRALKLSGMARALETQLDVKESRELSFEDRLAMLIDAEALEKDNSKTASRIRSANFRLAACMEDLKVKTSRGLDKSTITAFAICDWVRDKSNLAITGATGAGKTYLACALGHQACRQGFTVIYHRATTLFDDLVLAKADGRYKQILSSIASKKLFILDDFGLEKLTAENRRDMLEIMEQRYERASTIITSQLEVEHWHQVIGDPTLADAILDRFVHNSHELKVKGEKGESMRKKQESTQNG
jgi:DNA replication protein DnaC